MTLAPRYSYKIAVGYNNAAGFVNIELIVPSLDRAFFAPEGYNNFNRGQRVIRGDGLIARNGFPYCFWLFSAVTRKQVSYLRATYGDSGPVTIATRPDEQAYQNYNAIIDLPDPDATQRHYMGTEDYKVNFFRLVAI